VAREARTTKIGKKRAKRVEERRGGTKGRLVRKERGKPCVWERTEVGGQWKEGAEREGRRERTKPKK
jgi:hypothetical protein